MGVEKGIQDREDLVVQSLVAQMIAMLKVVFGAAQSMPTES